jgi:hypothetical protein
MSRQQRHKRSPFVNKTVAAVAVLALGGGGIAFIAANANAGTGSKKSGSNQAQASTVSATDTISCPDVGQKLPEVPARAREEVDRNLALLDKQIAEAYNRLKTSQGQGGPNFVQNAIIGPLKDKRVAAIDRIAIAIGRGGTKPQGLEALAPCELKKGTGTPVNQPVDGQTGGQQGGNNGGNNGGQQGGNTGGNNGGQQGGNNGGNNGGQQGGGPVQGPAERPEPGQPPWRRVDRHVRVQVRHQREQAPEPGQHDRGARCEQRRPPHARLRGQPDHRRLLHQREPGRGGHHLHQR